MWFWFLGLSDRWQLLAAECWAILYIVSKKHLESIFPILLNPFSLLQTCLSTGPLCLARDTKQTLPLFMEIHQLWESFFEGWCKIVIQLSVAQWQLASNCTWNRIWYELHLSFKSMVPLPQFKFENDSQDWVAHRGPFVPFTGLLK